MLVNSGESIFYWRILSKKLLQHWKKFDTYAFLLTLSSRLSFCVVRVDIRKREIRNLLENLSIA
jgi:hypothetical protein